MKTAIMYWALVVAGEPGFVGEVFQTFEPCQVQMETLKHSGVEASCVPTTEREIQGATTELKALARVLYDDKSN
jgi:hypothetical protein